VDKWKALGCEAVLIPNGCDAAGLTAVDVAPLPDDVGLPPPVLGVVGTLGERIDFTLLRALADHGYSLLLVGSRQKNFPLERIADLLDRPNVRWVGPRPYAALPSYLRLIDVGLVPYRDSAFNRASFPLKTLEYLAAGRAVVSTELPAVRWLDTDLIRVASDVNGFCASVHEAVAEHRTSELLARRRAFAMQHDWSHRVDDLLGALG
jgi:teichuronic acid biosynthesis glycosyltransferase TuaH